ncbi:MAG: 3'-5' exonuclease [Proteobacteria bacterium]|nr:3'-5' exonuclease [Pseudomonadota bacterium]MBU1595211.1 3'-5' exonuclease [Pseudomonadota bacterium]
MGGRLNLPQWLGRLLGEGRRQAPPSAITANNEACRKLDQNRALEDCVFTVLDTELTGLSPGRDEIVSIGAVRIRNMQILQAERFHSLVKPDMPMPKLSTLIHRITPERIIQAPPLSEVLPGFLSFIEGTLLVGHFVDLDMAFLASACRRLYGDTPANPCLDTMRLAKSWQHRLQGDYYDRYDQSLSFNLSSLARRFGLPIFPSHDALHDAMQTAYLFLYLVKKLRSTGIKTLRELHRPMRTQTFGF